MAQRRGEETRSHILDVAGELFAQRGYDATSVADICASAGVTKGAFYHHFASKQSVFLELRDRWLTPLDAQLTLTRATGETVPDALQRMSEMVQVVFEAAGDDQRQQIFLELLSAARHDATILPALLAPTRKYRKLFSRLIAAGIKEGTLRKVDRELAAQVFVSLGLGLIMQNLLDPDGADWGTISAQAIPLLLQGLENK